MFHARKSIKHPRFPLCRFLAQRKECGARLGGCRLSRDPKHLYHEYDEFSKYISNATGPFAMLSRYLFLRLLCFPSSLASAIRNKHT